MILPSESTGQESWQHALARDELADRLDRLFCHHLLMVHRSLAVSNRLTGTPRLLLRRPLQRETHDHLRMANRLAGRVTQLGGVLTADPSDLVYRAPGGSFDLPQDTSDVYSILEQALESSATAIRAYHDLLDRIGDHDTVTRRLVEDLTAEVTTRQHESRSSLGHGSPEAGPFTTDGSAE